MSYRRYKIYCVDEAVDKFVTATSAPTVCPTNASHTVRTKSVAVIDENPNGYIIEIAKTTTPSTPGLNKNIMYFDSTSGLFSTMNDVGFIRKYYGSKNNVIYVSPQGESDYTTIKDAVSAANAMLPSIPSTVLVQPGTYIENNPITIGSTVSLLSVGGPLNTIVTAQNPTSRLFVQQVASGIRGFTMAGVTGNDAVYFDGSLGQASINECLILNSKTGVHVVNGPGIYSCNRVAAMAKSTPSSTTIGTAYLAEDGGMMLMTDCVAQGYAGNLIGVGYKATGINGVSSAPSKVLFMGGATTYCTSGAVVDNGGVVETYTLRADNNADSFVMGNLGTTSSLLINNTTIYNSSVNDLNILSTGGTIRAFSSQLDPSKISNPNNVRLQTVTCKPNGDTFNYANTTIYGNLAISGNLNITGNVIGIYSGVNFPINGTVNTDNYSILGRMIFPGTTIIGDPTNLKCITRQDAGAVDHTIIITDSTNGNAVVATTGNLTNTSEAITTITQLGNLSTTEAIWHIHAGVNNTSGNVFIYDLQLNT